MEELEGKEGGGWWEEGKASNLFLAFSGEEEGEGIDRRGVSQEPSKEPKSDTYILYFN